MEKKGLKVDINNIEKLYKTTCKNDSNKNILDPTYIQCLTEKSKYDYYLKPITNISYSSFLENVNNEFDDIKKAYKYAKKTCDIAVINNPIERKIYKKTSQYIINGKRTFTVKDAKIISRYFLYKECIDKGLYISLNSLETPIPSINITDFKNSLLDIKNAIWSRLHELGYYDSIDKISLNYKLLKNKKTKDIIDSKYNILSIIFHEARHAYQDKMIKNPNSYAYNILYMCKESLASFDEKYYRTNYDNLYHELDAEIYSKKKALNVIKETNRPLYNKINNLVREEISIYKKRINGYRSHKIGTEYFEATDAIEKEFLKFFNKSTAKKMIEKYPILGLQYNIDGSYKSIKELRKVKNELLEKGADSKEVNKLYDNLRWQYLKAKTNINNFYKDQNKRVNKTVKK